MVLYTTSQVKVIYDYHLGTEDMTLFLPRTGTTGRAGLVYAHGFLGTGTGAFLRDRNDTGDDLKALATMSLVVAAPDLGGPTTWGSDTAWQAVGTTFDWMVNNLGVDSSYVNLMGDSMGALTVLNWAWRNPSKVGRIALRSPVVNLSAFRNRNTGVFGTAIEDSYGGLSAFNAALPTHDPSAPGPIAEIRAHLNQRIRIWGALSDDLIPVSELDNFALAAGARVTMVPGEHADGVDQPPKDLTAWITGGV